MRHLPNFLTCCNLLCGCLGILYITGDPLSDRYPGLHAAYFVWAACVFDFFDGFAARKLNVSSPIGKELDSLADVVSFGVLPSLLMLVLIRQSGAPALLPYTALTIAVFSALRLAIFNVDETQRDAFKGLPTPANAIFLTALPFLPWTLSGWMLAGICIAFSLLLVSRISLFALKFKDFSWASNKLRFTFLICCVLLIAIFSLSALPAIIILYILLSLGETAVRRQT